ncbi:hypothetical protein KL86DYS1_10548 [uncultured Dysgonomonas sp.]|uniref:Uncharacterized protein n=1 Tax=uncultured Dysgonomonas sp. TaxID=206096 RepID=A0A212IYH3_9BACT|nr:hypothetical protein KL86DYS1_10548 [uncultured Dysgonomonas sp.]
MLYLYFSGKKLTFLVFQELKLFLLEILQTILQLYLNRYSYNSLSITHNEQKLNSKGQDYTVYRQTGD